MSLTTVDSYYVINNKDNCLHALILCFGNTINRSRRLIFNNTSINTYIIRIINW